MKPALKLASDAQDIGPIQRGIPLPPRPGKQPSRVRQAIAELQPGESRPFTGVNVKSIYHYIKVLHKEDSSAEWTSRTINASMKVVRVWRVK